MSGIHIAFSKLIFDQTIFHGRLLEARVHQYDELMKEVVQLFDILKLRLPDDDQDLLFDYEEKINYLHSLAETFMYEQGLKDGFVLRQMLMDR
jgi:hypothetical protein